MGGDLGAGAGQVHAKAREVLDFWFGLPPAKHYAKDAALDREIAERFADWVENVAASDATHCWGDPDTLLGALIAVDQFSRNIHRGSAAAFANDDLAQWLSLHAIGQGWDERYPLDRRAFLYLPLMHAENRGLQALGVGKFEQLGNQENLGFALAHRDAIMRFGRFPGRNAALGRSSTPEETQWLKENDGGW